MSRQSLEKTVTRRLSAPKHAQALHVILREAFGTGFTFFDLLTGARVTSEENPIHCQADMQMDAPAIAAIVAMAAGGQARVVAQGSDHFRVILVLHGAGSPVLAAAGDVPALTPNGPARAVEHTRLQNWAQAVSERLRLGDQLAVRAAVEQDLREQATKAWQVNLTLGDAVRRLRPHTDEEKNRQHILTSALALLDVEALLWLPCQRHGDACVVGDLNLAQDDCYRLVETLALNSHAGLREPLLCNNPAETDWGAQFPQISNFMVFAVQNKPATGWVIAVNKRKAARAPAEPGAEKAPRRASFRHSDAAVLSPFVSLLELHTRTFGHIQDLKGLLVGLARSLTAAIDAKDAYTAGHSERVARIAIEIGRELGLAGDQLSDVYLVGLLHDIGKIGIRDAILCKAGPLTAEEYDHVKQHVTIGYKILKDLHPIRNLLPGVLNHHERYDGKGYPEGLVGEKIPFLARLLAVADSFDAMNTQRPYREPLPLGRVVETLAKGAGSQWDPRVIDAFMRCKDKLVSICQRGVGESLRQAIDTALGPTESSRLWVSMQ
jgi:HD-GYP domain-containing protein (c-di-GMP phosphodiesterase class II)